MIEYLSLHTYRHTYQIVDHIWKTYRIRFSVSGLNKWLHQHGFSYKKPKGVPHKFSAKAQSEFIKKYEEIKAQVSEESIYFMGAMHPTQATKVSFGWIRKGKNKTIETTGRRTRVILVGAMNLNKIGSAVVRKYDAVNGETVELFLQELRDSRQSTEQLHLVLGGAGYNKTEAVKNKAEKLNIKLHYLPPYSPNLNPIELLWKVMNEHVRNNKYFTSPKEFREQIMLFFRKTLPEIGNTLKSRINDNFQVLPSAS